MDKGPDATKMKRTCATQQAIISQPLARYKLY